MLEWQGSSLWKGRCRVIPRGVCPVANLEGGFESYLRLLSPKTAPACPSILACGRSWWRATFTLADDSTVDAYFADLVRLHQERWSSTGKPGCFASRRFTEFHRSLARKWVPEAKAVLARLSIENEVLAVLYGFVIGTKFDFYQSGVRRTGLGSIVSPGTTANLTLMSRLAEQGITHYDFLAAVCRCTSKRSPRRSASCWASKSKDPRSEGRSTERQHGYAVLARYMPGSAIRWPGGGKHNENRHLDTRHGAKRLAIPSRQIAATVRSAESVLSPHWRRSWLRV